MAKNVSTLWWNNYKIHHWEAFELHIGLVGLVGLPLATEKQSGLHIGQSSLVQSSPVQSSPVQSGVQLLHWPIPYAGMTQSQDQCISIYSNQCINIYFVILSSLGNKC